MWTYKNNHYYRTLMKAGEYNCNAEEQVYNPGVSDLLKNVEHVIGYYIIDGTMTIYDQTFQKDTLLWITGGKSLSMITAENLHVIAIETQMALKEETNYTSYHDADLAWSHPLADQMTASRHMIRPEDYGVKIQTCIYTKDFIHQWHTHTCAHGFYVLSGMLEYDFDDGQKHIYGPGEFAVSKPGDKILHVEAPHAVYCKYLFIGDGPFDFIVNGENIYGK